LGIRNNKEKIMQKVKSFLKSVISWIGAHPLIERALQTVWQAIVGYLLAIHTAPHSTQDVQVILTGAYGAALSALKTYLAATLPALLAKK